MSQFYNPVTVYSGIHGCRELAESLQDEFPHVSRVLLLTRGDRVEQDESLRPLWSWMQQRSVLIKELFLSNPNLDDIFSLNSEVRSFDYELIVAIGGGSVMDAAKSIAAIQHLDISSVEELRSVIVDSSYAVDTVTPWIGVPTTAGTGSEVTKWATVWDTELSCKYSISNNALYATKALISAELMKSMPLRLSMSTGLDSMCHATEAYWSVQTNPISRIYALAAIERIRTYLPQLIEDSKNTEIREQLALASLYSGLAFSNTRTTACHSISYPLSLIHGVDHVIAASLLLGSIARINEPELIEPEKLFRAYGISQVEEIGEIVKDIYKLYQIPYRLSEYGVTEKSIPRIAEGAFTKGRMDNNPVNITESQVREVLTELL